MKKIVAVNILVLLIIIIFGTWKFSERIINTGETEENVLETNKKIEFDQEDTEEYVRTPELLYDEKSATEDQVNFLGENYDKFSSVLSDISDNYKKVFIMLPKESNLHGEHIKTLELGAEEIGYKSLNEQGYDGISVRNLTIIGFLGNTVVIYAVNYPTCESKELVVVNYASRKFSTENADALQIGEEMGVFIPMDGSTLVSLDGFSVIYTI